MGSMQAMVRQAYGPPDVLRLETIARPTVGDHDVLIRVRAAALNPLDWHFLTGTPYALRLAFGPRKPKRTILGVDAAGTVEAVGRSVTRLRPGDEVFGLAAGSLAEYACAREDSIAAKPKQVTFEQAAATPVAGVTALQALRDKGRLQAGERVVINGAAGGVGTSAVQIAKAFGAEVTGVCSTANLDLVRSIGADHAVDYTREDFVDRGPRFDLMVDNVGNRSLRDCRRVLRPRGVLVMVVAGPKKGLRLHLFGRMVGAIVVFRATGRRAAPVLAQLNPPDLLALGELIATGKISPVIRTYPLTETREAFRRLGSAHAQGKIVITT